MEEKEYSSCSSEEVSKSEEKEPSNEEELECAVCLQPCVHPVRLPCSHIFCFLCVKGVANQSKRCAMCRQEIPADFLDHPNLLKKIEEKDVEPEGYQWFYEGRNGWWQYDERTTLDLEAAYNSGLRVCEVLVAGFLYIVDFDRMMQQRRNDPSRRRRIKRDLSSIPKKGVAGLKTLQESELSESDQCVDVGSNSNEDASHSEGSNVSNNLATTAVNIPSITSTVVIPLAPHNSTSLNNQTALHQEVPEQSELDHVHLLHSDLYRSIHTGVVFPIVSRSSNPSSLSAALRSRFPNIGNSSASYSTYNQPDNIFPESVSCTNNLNNDEEQTISSGTARNEGETVVSDLTNRVRSLTLNNDENNVQYYSLDGTEEYSLPHDNDDL